MSSITAIIPTYNRAAMLKECIESVVAQTRPVQQIIVVNDGSTDDTDAVVRGFGDRVTLISKVNGGKSTAINTAMAEAQFDYIWICDDDDVADPKAIENLAGALDAGPELGFVFGTFKIFREGARGRIFFPPTYWCRAEEINPQINFLEEMFTFQYAMLVRRSLYQQVGPFREDMVRSQDYEMTLRLARKAKSLYLPEVIFYQRQHEGIRGSAKDSFAAGSTQQKWLAYDQKIFAAIHCDYALEEFTPSFALPWCKDAADRAALIQRACILAKRALWQDALVDLHQAATAAKTVPSAEEINIAETIIRTSLPWAILSKQDAWVRELHAIAFANPFGQALVLALCRPLVWMSRNAARRGKVVLAVKLLFLLCRILGLRGTMRRVHMTLSKV